MMKRTVPVFAAAVMLVGGGALAKSVSDAASGTATCAQAPKRAALPTGWSFSGLPKAMNLRFGYGRGTRESNALFTATTSRNRTVPPTAFRVLLLPLTNTQGDQIDALASAIRQDNTGVYILQVCLDATGHPVTAGSYSGQVLFPGQTSVHSSSAVTATFQNQAVPWILWFVGPWLLLLGVLYTALILIRRADPKLKLDRTFLGKLSDTLLSTNGIVALVAGAGAGFAVWRVQIYANPTWGAQWPDVAVGIVSVVVAASGAASVPLAFSSE